jgi:hypothetical protein
VLLAVTCATFAAYSTGALTSITRTVDSPSAEGWPVDAPTGPPGEALALAGRQFTLHKANLWRDYMPMRSPGLDRDGLLMTFEISAGSGAFPADTRADRVWLRKGGEAWEARLYPASNPAPTERRVFRPEPRGSAFGIGPRWEPGEKVEVLVRLRAADGSKGYLRADDVEIDRTD